MTKMKQLTQELCDELGDDTKNLTLRVGLHSGPVTAGVLRGDKSRFQLFGDTVNTASRMESNGLPGRIHCSQSTADELTELGRSHWLTPRVDKVVAKGKGEMQTYWVNVLSGETTSSTGRSSSGNFEGVGDVFGVTRLGSTGSLEHTTTTDSTGSDSSEMKRSSTNQTANGGRSMDGDTRPVASPVGGPGFHRKLYPDALTANPDDVMSGEYQCGTHRHFL